MTVGMVHDRSAILEMPGARLYYEVWGEGPTLLMIPGGPTDAGVFAGIAALLCDRYRVVTYDPRGNSRSVVEGPPEDQRMDVHGDDAARLLRALSGGPAFVFGNSGGAQIGLNLAARYPQLVRTLVAHEPPCTQLLADAPEQRAFMERVFATYKAQGVVAAMQAFEAGAGLEGEFARDEQLPPSPQATEMQETFARMGGNIEVFLAHGMRQLASYVPDVERLRSQGSGLVIGVGEASGGQLAHRTAVELAKRLGLKPVAFPGGHGGYGDRPVAFAERLDGVLRTSLPAAVDPLPRRSTT